MALIYGMTCSLDGYINDADGDFGFGAPSDDRHRFVNDVFRGVDTFLLGRRDFAIMDYWNVLDVDGDLPPAIADFAQIWRGADKIVYSRTLTEVSGPRTRLEATFDPATIATMKEAASGDLAIGGAELAGHAIRADLVDVIWVYIAPVVVGGGTPMFSPGIRTSFDLIDERRFDDGTVGLQYRPRTGTRPS